jgi:hypothetical protein
LEEDLKKLNEKLEEATTSITAQEKRIALLEKRSMYFLMSFVN